MGKDSQFNFGQGILQEKHNWQYSEQWIYSMKIYDNWKYSLNSFSQHINIFLNVLLSFWAKVTTGTRYNYI